MENQTINVLIERDGDLWVAECIEHDIVTQAESLDDLRVEIPRILTAHIAACEELGMKPFEIPAAPADTRDRFDRARIRGCEPAFTGMLGDPAPGVGFSAWLGS